MIMNNQKKFIIIFIENINFIDIGNQKYKVSMGEKLSTKAEIQKMEPENKKNRITTYDPESLNNRYLPNS